MSLISARSPDLSGDRFFVRHAVWLEQLVNDIGKIYENGWGVAKDESIANEWYQKAKAALSAEVHEE